MYIKDNFTEDSLFKTGTEIISINGVKADDLLKEYLLKVYADGFNKQGEIGWAEFYFQLLTDFKFDFPSSYVMEVRSRNGTLALKNAISLDLPLNELNKDNPSLKIIDSLKTAVLTFPTFENETWRTFLDPSFKKIKKKKLKT